MGPARYPLRTLSASAAEAQGEHPPHSAAPTVGRAGGSSPAASEGGSGSAADSSDFQSVASDPLAPLAPKQRADSAAARDARRVAAPIIRIAGLSLMAVFLLAMHVSTGHASMDVIYKNARRGLVPLQLSAAGAARVSTHAAMAGESRKVEMVRLPK